MKEICEHPNPRKAFQPEFTPHYTSDNQNTRHKSLRNSFGISPAYRSVWFRPERIFWARTPICLFYCINYQDIYDSIQI